MDDECGIDNNWEMDNNWGTDNEPEPQQMTRMLAKTNDNSDICAHGPFAHHIDVDNVLHHHLSPYLTHLPSSVD